MSKAIGIDLGTTNSCVAVVDGGTPQVLPNKAGYKTTPSVVAISESGRRLVGQMAKRQAITNAKHTVFASKRLIGRPWDGDELRYCVESVPYEVHQSDNGEVRVRLRDKDYSLPELSSIILQEMKMIAEEYLGEPVTQAVITVPAYFNDNQRQATRDAGQIAGLEILRIINEPTAAALAYGHGKNENATIAIYDLGGGTFDISILKIEGKYFNVLSTAGDTFLGGEDFDARIIERLALDFARDHRVDLRKDDMSLQRLRDAAEKAKTELTTSTKTEISLPFIHSSESGEPLHLYTALSREEFEASTEALVQRTIKICQYALDNAGVTVDDVDEVILVGGMTRVPCIQRAVREFFGKAPSKSVHPDEAVAVGAAIQAAAMTEDESDVVLLDVTPHSLGIMLHGGAFEKIIQANTSIPTRESRRFSTVTDKQTAVKIVVLQGESDNGKENELLGEFVFSGLRSAPAGEVEIDVIFDIDADGIVTVSARDVDTGKEDSITVTSNGPRLSEQEIQQMIQENEAYLIDLRKSEDFERLRSSARSYIRKIQQLIKRTIGLDNDARVRQARERATDAIEAAESALEGSQRDDIDRIKAIDETLKRAYEAFLSVLPDER